LSAQRKQGRMYEEDGKFYVVVESAIPNWAKSGSLFPSSRHKAAAPNLSLPQQKAVSHEVEEAIMALERHLHTYTEAVNFAIAILRGKP